MDDIIARIEVCREELARLSAESSSETVARRARILLGLCTGLSHRAVSRQLCCGRWTVEETLRKFRSGGVEGLRDKRQRRFRLARREEIVGLLPSLVAGQPDEHGWLRSTWSIELVALEVKERLGVEVSRSHMGRLLHEAGCRRVKPRPTIALAPPDKEEQMERLRTELSKATRQDVVLFADEVDIHLNPKTGLDWTPPKVRKLQVTPGQNQKRYMAGAYNPKTEKLTFVQGAKKNSDLFISLLQTLVKRYRGFATIHLVLDNFIIHRSKKTHAAVAALAGKVKLHWLHPIHLSTTPSSASGGTCMPASHATIVVPASMP